MDRGAWWDTFHEIAESDMNKANEHTDLRAVLNYMPDCI